MQSTPGSSCYLDMHPDCRGVATLWRGVALATPKIIFLFVLVSVF